MSHTKVSRSQTVQKTYSAEAALWKALNRKDENFDELHQTFLDLLKKQKAKTLLDVGCGIGWMSVAFAKKGLRVTGIDFSSGMITEAQKNREGLPIDFIHTPMLDYNPRKKFDAIWSNCSLHNMPKDQLELTIKHLVGLLNPGGLLFIRMRHGEKEGLFERNNIKRYYRYSSPREIKQIVKNVDLALKWKHTWYMQRFGIPYFNLIFQKTSKK